MSENDFKNIKKIFENAKKGNKEAFSEIYEVYFKPLYRYVYLRIGNKAESDDLAQDIFIKAFNSAEEPIPQNSSLIIHFYDIARKSIMDWKRKRRCILSSDESMENYSDDKTEKTDEDLKKEELDNLRKAARELSDEQQDAIILKFVGNLSNEDIGSLLAISSRSARRLEAQGLILIRDILKKQYERQF